MINRFRFIIIVSCILLSIIPAKAQENNEIQLTKLGDDPLGDGDQFYDIKSAWMGENETQLFLIVKYWSVQTWGIFTNITIRTQNESLYLIMAYYFSHDSSSFIHITQANSLEDNHSMLIGSNYFIAYETGRVQFYEVAAEIAISIDWNDIGGKGELDIVFWSKPGLDFFDQINDKMPDVSYLTYSGVTTIDRTLDILGFVNVPIDPITSETSETTANKASTTITSTTITSMSSSLSSSLSSSSTTQGVVFTQDTENAPSNNFLPLFLLLLILLIAIGLPILFIGGKHVFTNYKIVNRKNVEFQEVNSQFQNNTIQEDLSQTRFIPEINMKVQYCCYQTARLKENYCLCGRAIPDRLFNYFNSEID